MDKEKVKGTVLKSMSKSNRKTKKQSKTSAASQTLPSSKNKTDIQRKYKTRSYKKNNIMRRATALLQSDTICSSHFLSKLAPTEFDKEEHCHILLLDDIRAITKVQNLDQNLDLSYEGISNDVISTVINTLNSDSITDKEAAIGY